MCHCFSCIATQAFQTLFTSATSLQTCNTHNLCISVSVEYIAVQRRITCICTELSLLPVACCCCNALLTHTCRHSILIPPVAMLHRSIIYIYYFSTSIVLTHIIRLFHFTIGPVACCCAIIVVLFIRLRLENHLSDTHRDDRRRFFSTLPRIIVAILTSLSAVISCYFIPHHCLLQ